MFVIDYYRRTIKEIDDYINNLKILANETKLDTDADINKVVLAKKLIIEIEKLKNEFESQSLETINYVATLEKIQNKFTKKKFNYPDLISNINVRQIKEELELKVSTLPIDDNPNKVTTKLSKDLSLQLILSSINNLEDQVRNQSRFHESFNEEITQSLNELKSFKSTPDKYKKKNNDNDDIWSFAIDYIFFERFGDKFLFKGPNYMLALVFEDSMDIFSNNIPVKHKVIEFQELDIIRVNLRKKLTSSSLERGSSTRSEEKNIPNTTKFNDYYNSEKGKRQIEVENPGYQKCLEEFRNIVNQAIELKSSSHSPS